MLSTIAAGFLSLVFLRALLHKLGGYAEFVGNLRDYRVVPETLAPAAAAGLLVAAETLAAVGLLVPATRSAAAVLAAALLLLYAAAIALNLLRGRTSIDCGCGGSGQGISRLHVLRNLAAGAVRGAGDRIAGNSADGAGRIRRSSRLRLCPLDDVHDLRPTAGQPHACSGQHLLHRYKDFPTWIS